MTLTIRRAEPNYSFAAEQVLADKALTGKDLSPKLREIVELAHKSAEHPESTPTRLSKTKHSPA